MDGGGGESKICFIPSLKTPGKFNEYPKHVGVITWNTCKKSTGKLGEIASTVVAQFGTAEVLCQELSSMVLGCGFMLSRIGCPRLGGKRMCHSDAADSDTADT